MTKEFLKIWGILTPSERRKALGMLFLVILMAMIETAGVLSIMPFLSVLGRPDVVHENVWLQQAYETFGFADTRSFIIALGAVSITVVVVSSAVKIVTQHLLNRFVHLQRHSISARLLSKYLGQPYEFFLSRNTAELNKNILSETDQLMFNLVQPLVQMIAQGAVVLAMVIVILVYDPLMALCIVAVVGSLYALIYSLVRQRLGRIGAKRVAANRERYQASTEALSGIKDVKIANASDAYMQRFRRSSREYSRDLAANDTLSQTPLYMVEAVGYSGLILIALFLLVRSDDIAQVLPALGLYGFAAYRMLPAAQIMYRGFAKLRFSGPALDTIHRDLSLHDESGPITQQALTPQREIRLENIRFAYPASPDKPILDGFDLTIPVNTSVGIVGKSGAGKSTVMDILLGLLPPQAGILSVDDTSVTAINAANWQRAIGYVPQHIFLSDLSVAENIALGVPKQEIDMQAVEHAARTAQIHDFIVSELPHGYDTLVGERGIRLSGGQRQRVGIARAIYRNPQVLLFDEATSALDDKTEKALIKAIRSIQENKTLIMISHDQSSLSYCSKIVTIQPKSPSDAPSPPKP